MAIPLNRDLDMQTWQILNAVFQNLAVAPQNPKVGQYYFNTANKLLYYWDGTKWVTGKVYTQGTGILISASDEISINTEVVALKEDLPTKLSDLTDDSATHPINTATTLNGLTTSITELNYVDGVTSSIQDQLDDKLELDSISATAPITYDSTTGTISAQYDSTPTAGSDNLMKSKDIKIAIDNAISSAVKYEGEWDATGQTDYSSITLPVKKGYMYYVSGGSEVTIGGITWNVGDYLLVNENVEVGGTLSNVSKIDNTESSDIVRLNVTQTITNKTINATNNTISNLSASNLATGVLLTSIRAVASASDTSWVSEKAVATALHTKVEAITGSNPALTVSNGLCTWTINNSLGTTTVGVHVYRNVDNIEVLCESKVTASQIQIIMNSDTNIAEATYRMVAFGLPA